MFENPRKSLIQHCERSELRLHFEWTKVYWKCPKMVNLASFWKPEACGQAVLPDRSVLKNCWKMPKYQKFKCDILSNFQTMCSYQEFSFSDNLCLTLLFGAAAKVCQGGDRFFWPTNDFSSWKESSVKDCYVEMQIIVTLLHTTLDDLFHSLLPLLFAGKWKGSLKIPGA